MTATAMLGAWVTAAPACKCTVALAPGIAGWAVAAGAVADEPGVSDGEGLATTAAGAERRAANATAAVMVRIAVAIMQLPDRVPKPQNGGNAFSTVTPRSRIECHQNVSAQNEIVEMSLRRNTPIYALKCADHAQVSPEYRPTNRAMTGGY